MTDSLIGAGEIYDAYGLTRQQVRRLIASGEFPQPVAALKRGRVWDGPEVERAIEQLRSTGRLQNGHVVPKIYLEASV